MIASTDMFDELEIRLSNTLNGKRERLLRSIRSIPPMKRSEPFRLW
jgi:hypothetical protein